GVYGAVKVQEYRALVAKVEARVADARSAIAEAHAGRDELQRRRDEAFRRFDSRDPEGGEAEWGEAVALTPKVDRSYKQALQAVEGALILDPGSEEARSILAETLYERALLAEQGHDTKQVEELRERLDLYDEAGEYRARWEAPGRLRINVRPAGTRVTVAGYVKDAKGRVSLGSTSLLGDTPVNDATLAPGSYLLVFTRGESSINYPLLVQRGEELEIGFEMPEAGGIPDGYVYIPPGRFLFGSADDETMRRSFFNAPPVHNVTTGAYLISKREVTFGEWFDFVRAQPMAERARRLTHESRISVDLVGEDAFTLSVTEVETPATVGLGQPYRYASRADGRDQEWTRWPVVGISPEDAQAYVRWLADTGRLPGARLCDAWEWERALRGADSRRYPHGDDLQPGDANFDQTYGGDGKGLDEVGGYPASRSPFGVDDIIGNAMEWVASAQDAGMFELRGGSFYYDTIMAHGYNRAVMPETFREWSSGLRVCASAPATPR
ncbi:MAG TPA: SUMF1/EgtB/PvdO family nonheme iron enzyme, partial [Nannocystaceae bacterium]|nr:SUMF1/EgtB/PvdO family nonheme iron enzyme [Nannocystaceae bacterium]